MKQKQLVWDPRRKTYVERYIDKGPGHAVEGHGRKLTTAYGIGGGRMQTRITPAS